MQPTVETHLATDGYLLHYRHWRPATAPRGRIVYLHGIQSHGGWYAQSCRALCEAGFEVFFLDRRGSGLNRADRGHAASAQQLVDDVVDFLHFVKHADQSDGQTNEPKPLSSAPALPLVLLAVSWGGKLAAAVAGQVPELIDGLGLLYPAIGARVHPKWYQVLALRLACRLGLGRRQVAIPLDDPALFTGTPQWQRFIAGDPDSLRRASLSLLRAGNQLDRRLHGLAQRIATPTLMMLAGRDQIIDNRRTRAFFDHLATPSKRLIVYPDAQHTLEFEPDTQPFLVDLVAWVDQVTQTARTT